MPKLSLYPIIAVCSGVIHFLLPLTIEAQSFSDFRKKYLKAETFKETEVRIDPNNVKSIFYQIMKDVVYDEPDIAADMVFHTNLLIHRDINARGVFKPLKNGESYISGCIEYYEDVLESLECVGLMVRTYRRDISGEIPFSGEGNDAQQFALLGHFLSLGGNYDTVPALEQMLSDLRTVCGEGQPVFLAPYFFDFAYHLRPAQRDQTAKWAIEKSRDPDLTVSGIGEAIHLGLAMFERAEHTPISSRDLWRGNTLDSRLIEILQNNALSPAWRAGFTALIGNYFREELSPALCLEIGRTLTLVLKENIPFPGTSFKYSIAAFLRGSNEDQAWRAQGIDLVNAWEKRTSKLFNTTPLRLNPGGDWTVPMMELTCRVGTPEQIRSHYNEFCLDDLVYPGLWINLVKAKQYDLANQAHLKQAPLTEYSNHNFQVDTAYDAALARSTPAYLATIKDQNVRSFAELLLAATPDPESPKPDQHDSTIQTRLCDFAKKHKTMPEWSNEQKIRAFEALTLSQKCTEIKDWIESNQIGLENRIEQEEPRIRPYWAARIEMYTAMEELENGLRFPIELWWGRSVEDDNQILSRRRGDLCRAILMMTDERITSACENRDTGRLENFLPISRSILESVPEYVYRPYVRRFMIRSLTAHSLCSKMDRWTKWWQSIDPARRRHLISLLPNSSDLVDTLETALNPNDLPPEKVFESPEIRKEILGAIFSSEWVDKGGTGYSNLATAASLRLLTERDIYDIGEKMARKAPRDGSSWREFLGILSDYDQLDEALRILEEEINVTDATLPIIEAFKIEKLMILRVLKQEDRAEKFLAEFRNTDFDLPREYQTIVKNLKKR